ncbi:kinase-like protein [Coniochaeta ligniaria NRRL 30616]|uniref:EKC/KEOPS complex subunit BUD32 n=1 Tax=Coniochaeta ligniaria NRRL 30616 TaxID=1408157 RepID=A0A1J7J966_9PEZI|nr:kinase-like protein [Coniochaeta ligniaria NRRL 30616]
MPVFGRSLNDFWHDYGGDVEFTRGVSTQITEALAFLHSKGVCHGDFRPRNMLFKIRYIDQLSLDQILSMFTNDYRLDVPPPPYSPMEDPRPHLPKYIYPSEPLRPPVGLASRDVVVSDFGEAYHISEPPVSTGIPLAYAPPEVILPNKTATLSFGVDIWALGQTIGEIRLGHGILGDFAVSDYFRSMEDILGPLPEPYRTIYFERGYQRPSCPPASELSPTDPVTMKAEEMAKNRKQRLEREGFEGYLESIVRSAKGYGTSMQPGEVLGPDERDVGFGCKWVTRDVPQQEADQLLDLFTKIIKYDPAERLSASDILAHPWLEPKKREYFATFMLDEDYEDMYCAADENKGPGEAMDVEMDDEDTPDKQIRAEEMAAAARETRQDVVEAVLFDAETLQQGDPGASRQNWLFAWFAWIAKFIIPRLYGGPMTLGGLDIYR